MHMRTPISQQESRHHEDPCRHFFRWLESSIITLVIFVRAR